MKIGIIALTNGSLSLAKKLRKQLNDAFIFTTSENNINAFIIKDSLKKFIKKNFFKYRSWIFITASGIAVRMISKLIKDKTKDPAVIVMDEKGDYVIPILSGHIGGANQLALYIAKLIDAKPVITTASDINKKLAVDTIAMKYSCCIDNIEKAKFITSLIVNEKDVSSIGHVPDDIPDYLTCPIDNSHGFIFFSNKKSIDMTGYNKPYVILIPKNIIIGLGCRKNIKTSNVMKAVKIILKNNNLDKRSIKYFATIDIKENEKGIIKTAEYYKTQIKLIDLQKIKSVEHKFITSDFVKQVIGAGCVAEPVSFLASNRTGNLLVNKTIINGVTIAVWEESEYEKR